MININELSAYALALSRVNGIGPKGVIRITEKFATGDALAAASTENLNHELGDKLSQILITQLRYDWREKLARARDSIARHRDANIIVLAINDVAYPPLLKRIADPPVLLYIRGSLSVIATLKAVAVVGTRTPTSSGTQIAERVSGFLAKAGYTIVSGLAKGIDTYAHRGCLSADGTTIAVLANSLEPRLIYPAENRPLAEEIIDRHGLLVSETPLGQMPQKSSFVQRDRIQSGLSFAVFPIQTDIAGGTMHTVRYAERDNRLLFCPIPIDGDTSESAWAGIRMLLRTNRAQSFDKSSYEQVLTRLQVYETVLRSNRETPVEDVETVKAVNSTSLPLFEEASARPDSGQDHPVVDSKAVNPLPPQSGSLFEEAKEKVEEQTFNNLKWLDTVEQVCRDMHISKEKYNELVGELRKRLFKPQGAKKCGGKVP